MIALIKGILLQANPGSIVLETGGIGYKIFIPVTVYSSLPPLGNDLTLHTSLVTREMAQTLYGFVTHQERELFECFMGVSGIGPKLALSLIGHLSLQELHQAIQEKDIPVICKVPGIGKKTAERLIIELRDKIGNLFSTDLDRFSVHPQGDSRSRTVNDAMSALINLGYNQMTAQKAMKKTLLEFPETIDLTTLITAALKNV